MHKYNNLSKYGMTAVKSSFQAYEPEQPQQPEQMQLVAPVKQNRFLPGERLLKKLNKPSKSKPLDMKMIEKSISDILDTL
jgi:hypothetical protein